MPEIAEVARCVHFLRQHIVSRRIKAVLTSADDPIVYQTAKTGLTAETLTSTLTGLNVVGAKQQGKYFWLEMDKPSHLLMHLGMTGWIKFRGNEGADYRTMSKRANGSTGNKFEDKEVKDEDLEPVASVMTPAEEWPPRFWKFILQMDDGQEAAFVDARRLGRVRIINVPAGEMRKTSPLKENGPDPVIDRDTITLDWFKTALQKKRVPVKSFLLDQSILSGVGNWVADETLYQAHIHPEQYSQTLSSKQVESLRNALVSVCTTACDLLADSSKFPANWLMRHRWGKGKKDGDKLPNGERLSFITVGGRTSAFVATRQKKSGDSSTPQAPEQKNQNGEKKDSAATSKSKRKSDGGATAGKAVDAEAAKSPDITRSSRRRSTRGTHHADEEVDTSRTESVRKKRKT